MNKSPLGYLYVLIATAAWGSLYVVSKYALDYVPPFTLLFLRYLIAALALFLIPRPKTAQKIAREDYKGIFFIGFVGYFLGVGAQFVGTRLAGASLSSLINSLCPVIMVFLGAVLLKERFTISKALALVASMLGAMVVIGGVGTQGMLFEGVLVSLFAVLTWSVISLVAKQATEKYDAITVTGYALLLATGFTVPVMLYEVATIPNIRVFEPGILGAIAFMGLVATALAHVCWNKALSLMEAGTCSLFYPIQPMVSVLLGALLLGEKMDSGFFIGAALIVCGVLLSVVGEQSWLPRLKSN